MEPPNLALNFRSAGMRYSIRHFIPHLFKLLKTCPCLPKLFTEQYERGGNRRQGLQKKNFGRGISRWVEDIYTILGRSPLFSTSHGQTVKCCIPSDLAGHLKSNDPFSPNISPGILRAIGLSTVLAIAPEVAPEIWTSC